MKAGVEPARLADLAALDAISVTGSPLSVDAFEWLYGEGEARLVGRADQRRDRHRVRLRCRVSDPPRDRGRDAGQMPRRRGRGVRRGGPPAGRRGRRAGRDRADADDAALLLERPGRPPLSRELLRDLSRPVAPWRLDPLHRPRHERDLRPLGHHDQPVRHPHGHGRDLSRRGGAARGARQPGGRLRVPRPPVVPAAVRRAAPGLRARRARSSSASGSASGPPRPRATSRTRSTRSRKCRARSPARRWSCRCASCCSECRSTRWRAPMRWRIRAASRSSPAWRKP